jgi:sirohydrochlorin ferrochelatase
VSKPQHVWDQPDIRDIDTAGMAFPTLVLAAYGTRLPAGRTTVDSIVMAVRRQRPALPVRLAHLDIQSPRLGEVGGKSDVVVPLLLARGQRVGVDLGRLGATVARHLGADDRLVGLASRRLDEAGALPSDDIVMVCAGSSDPQARLDIDSAARKLAKLRHTRITTATISTAHEVVEAQRRRGRVAVASWLVAAGTLSDEVTGCRADAIAAPLGLSVELVDTVLDRYDEALVQLVQRLA